MMADRNEPQERFAVPITAMPDGDDVVVVTLDDGKVNAFDVPFFTDLDAALDEHPDRAVVIAGREGFFSAGLNVKTMATLDDDGLTDLLVRFGRTMHRVWLEPRPVVVAATGHAIAGGTILAMCADHAVAAEGRYGWGLTETTIGFPLPDWIIAIARGNVRADRLDDLLLPGTTVSPSAAVAVGFADVAVPEGTVLETALSRARELAALPRATYAETKRRLRGPASAAALADIETDIRTLLAAR
jgi:enoyl-CoA hydratase